MAITALNDYNSFSGLKDLQSQASQDPDQAIKAAAQQFESIFINMMLKSMRDTVPEDSMFGGHTMDSYMNMMDQQLAVDLSVNGGIGLADIIERQLKTSVSLEK